jgi:hypothetical protein
MPFQVPTRDEVLVAGSLAGVSVTDAQARAIVDTIEHFESPESPCLGLKSWRIASVDESMVDRPPLAGHDAFVEVHFRYLSEHIEIAPLGPEVTLYNPDGSVLESQDFG